MFRWILVVALTCVFSAPAVADDIQKDQIKELILETLRENPEIVAEALDILEERQAEEERIARAAAMAEQRDLLFNDPNAVVLGNPEGDVTVVEFFDYNCGYCRRAFPAIQELLATDPNVRIVLREWPILGDESRYAARASLAARKQGLYQEFHNALMAQRGRATEASVKRIAEEIGLNASQLSSDMGDPTIQSHFESSGQLSQALGIGGTPAFVIGDEVIPGFIQIDQMREIIDRARADQG